MIMEEPGKPDNVRWGGKQVSLLSDKRREGKRSVAKLKLKERQLGQVH